MLTFLKSRIWLQIRPSWRPFVLPIWAVLALLLAWPAMPAASLVTLPVDDSEQLARTTIRNQVKALLAKDDFASLDTLASDYRATRAVTASGVRKLTQFYLAIHETAAAIPGTEPAAWDALTARFAAWQTSAPDSPTAVVANGIVLKRRAWAERPRRNVIEITTGSDTLFLTRLGMARRYLEANAAVGSGDPHYFSVLADLLWADNADMDVFVAHIAKGLAVDPHYDRLAFSSLDYFAPLMANANDQNAQKRFNAMANTLVHARGTAGAELYARLYWHADSVGYAAAAGFDWPRVVAGMDAVLARYDTAWNREHLARLACQRGDLVTARRLLAGSRARVTAVWPTETVRAACARGPVS